MHSMIHECKIHDIYANIIRREVDELEAQVWAELYGFPYYSTSAANGSGITEMFQVTKLWFNNILSFFSIVSNFLLKSVAETQKVIIKRICDFNLYHVTNFNEPKNHNCILIFFEIVGYLKDLLEQ